MNKNICKMLSFSFQSSMKDVQDSGEASMSWNYLKNSILGDYFIFRINANGPNLFRTPGSDLQHWEEYKNKPLK